MVIKEAESKEEFEQIFKLNHKTFVEEIPQHERRSDLRLVDKFHWKNTYIIAVKNSRLVGMVCYNTERPFSLDQKGVNIDTFVSSVNKIAEIRLLSVEKDFRNTSVTYKILKHLIKVLTGKGILFGLISATTKQLPFYHKIGFKPFGELIGKPGAYYQPMYISLNNLKQVLL